MGASASAMAARDHPGAGDHGGGHARNRIRRRCRACGPAGPQNGTMRRPGLHADQSWRLAPLPAARQRPRRDDDGGAIVVSRMWSWDAAFVAVGLAPLSVERAVVELDTLLSAQWSNGMIPHIVFANGVDGYFRGRPAGPVRRWPHTRCAPSTLPGSPSRRSTRSPCNVLDHARSRGRSTRRWPGLPGSSVGRSGQLASLAGRARDRTAVAGSRYVPRLGIRDGQLRRAGMARTPT